jgi:uncharacterized protein (DUF58 family)
MVVRPSLVDRFLGRSGIDHPPLVLTQQRVFVLPTRRGWVVAAMLLLMLVTSMNYALSLGYALTFLVSGLYGASLIHVYRNVAKIQIEPSGAPRAFAGEPLSFSFRVTNLTRYPRKWIRVWSGESEGAVPTLPPGGSALVSVPIATRMRGARRFGRFTVISDYPLGLWRAWGIVRFDYEGIVYPAPESGAPALPGSAGDSVTLAAQQFARLSEDQEVDGLREYQRGDPPRSIAWKAVARGRGWYSKRFAGINGQQWAALRWNDTAGLGDVERRLSRLAAWALVAERNGIPFSLELPGRLVPTGQGAAHLDSALSALGTFGGKRSEQ